MNKFGLATLVLVLAVLPAFLARAADAPPPAPNPAAGPNDPELGKLVETVMAARVAKKLELNDEQTVLMVRHLFEYKDQVAALRKQRQESVKKLKGAIQAAEPDAQIQSMLDELVVLDAQIADLRKSMIQRASEGLSVAQKAKLYVFVGEFEADLRRMIQKAREARKSGAEPASPGAQPTRWQRLFGGQGQALMPPPPPPPPADKTPQP